MRARAPPSDRSRAISAPVLPMPITRTDWPANGLALAYAALWMSLPLNFSIPGMDGITGSALNPDARMTCLVCASHFHPDIRSVRHHQNAASNRTSPHSDPDIRSSDFLAHSEDRRWEKGREAGRTVA